MVIIKKFLTFSFFWLEFHRQDTLEFISRAAFWVQICMNPSKLSPVQHLRRRFLPNFTQKSQKWKKFNLKIKEKISRMPRKKFLNFFTNKITWLQRCQIIRVAKLTKISRMCHIQVQQNQFKCFNIDKKDICKPFLQLIFTSQSMIV